MGDVDESFLCPVCQDVFQEPLTTPCGHIFCGSCIGSALKHKALCPSCRAPVPSAASLVAPGSGLSTALSTTVVRCRNKGCTVAVTLGKLREHEESCGFRDVSVKAATSSALTPQPPAGTDMTNRSTFTCPYCRMENLTSKDLVEHVTNTHGSVPQNRRRVVCPICAAMPWGDPNMRSSDFNAHLANRHRFEYNEFVDMGEQDDDQLRQAIARSLQEQ